MNATNERMVNRLLKQAERYQQSGTSLEEIQALVSQQAVAEGADQSVVNRVMKRVQNTETGESHGALGKPHNPVNHLAKHIASMRF